MKPRLIALGVALMAVSIPAFPQRPDFVNAAVESGIDFRHENGATPSKYMPETMSGGGLFFDYDNDGRPDLYVTNMGANTLYRNMGNGRFADVTAESGTGFELWSASCAFADIDNDGSGIHEIED
jgi:hypothetical protein